MSAIETTIPAREVFRSFSGLSVGLFYALAAVAMAVIFYGFWRRIEKYRRGRPANRMNRIWWRLLRAGKAIGQHSTLRKRAPVVGFSHALIFWGFVALFIGTLIIMIDHDFLRPLSPALQFWKGTFYLWYSLTLDVMGVGFLLGLGVMMFRRWRGESLQLDYTRPDRQAAEYDRTGYVWDDHLFLWGLLLIGVSGYILEGLRIAADRPPFEIWSVVGWQVANLFDSIGFTRQGASHLHFYTWWLHAVLALAFVAYIPYSKAAHMIVDILNLLFHDPEAGKRLPAVPEGAASMGYQTLTDLTWKELMDLDACTKCGRCHAACPARAGGMALSPRDLILELMEEAEEKFGGRSWLHETCLGGNSKGIGGGLIKAETLWACTTCLACVEACPVGIEHVPLIVQMRRKLVEDGAMDANLQSVLEKITRYGNSFGQSERMRGRWTQGLDFNVKDVRKEPAELLWFVGDYASYDPSLQELTRATGRVFHKAGLDFGILYDGEKNSGNDVRRVGEEGLFENLVHKNLSVIQKCKFKGIVTTDPHSYNTLKNEYPELIPPGNGAWQVSHYTEILASLLETRQLPLARRLSYRVTYHDPCYLARYNGVMEAPRRILRALGVECVEMPRSGEGTFCCGAGGGRLWMSDTRSPGVATPSEQRIEEALALGNIDIFVVACPKDVTMYRDAVKTSGNEGRIFVKDLIELVEEALGHEL